MGTLTGKIALLDGELKAAAANVDAKIATYDATNTALLKAVADLDAANLALKNAAVTSEHARTRLCLYLSSQYMTGRRATMTAVFTSTDANSLLEAVALQRYIGISQQRQLSQTILDTLASSNAEATQRGALQTADRLQKQAEADKTAAMNELANFQTVKTELAAQRVTLSKQAAAASGRLRAC